MSDYEEEMEQANELSIISISGPSKHDCGYCKGMDSSISFGIWAHSLTCNDYQDLIDRGWRRSGQYLYKPDLEKSCCPQYTIRLDTTRFNTSKSQKKIINKFNRYIKGSWDPQSQSDDTASIKSSNTKSKANNYVQVKSLKDFMHEPEETDENKHDFKTILEPSSYTSEKFELYAKYQRTIHKDKDISETGFKRFLVNSPLKIEKDQKSSVEYGSYHQKYMLNGKLFALAVIDILPKCVSSVYFIYDPDYSFLGLGKYSVFREISLVQEYHDLSNQLQYYYMGFYIHSCPKMNYKGQYLPSDLLDPIDYKWYPIQDFKKEFEKDTSFVSFAPEAAEKRNYPPGWLNPDKLHDQELEKVLILINEDRVAPVTWLVQFESSKSFKKSVTNYVCSVGLDLAHRIFLN